MNNNNKKSTLLLVDDVPGNIKTLRAILKDDYTLIIATNGPDAIEIARSQAIDLILLDVVMPGMDGFEVCSLLKKKEKTKNIPIIFVTAKNAVEDETKGLELGAVDFISKPVISAVVRVRVQNHLELRQTRQEVEQHRDRLLFERQFIEELLIKIRKTNLMESDNLRYLVDSVEKTTGDILFSTRRPDGVQYVFVGDFTGHGLQAAIGGPVVSDLFARMTRRGEGMGQILFKINQKLIQILPWGTFLAACCIELCPKTRQVRCWNGGMPPILILRKGEILSTVKSAHPALGILNEGEFDATMTSTTLQEEDRIYLYSDGVIETSNPERKLFGEERLKKELQNIVSNNHPLENLKKNLSQYRQTDLCNDDITLIEITV